LMLVFRGSHLNSLGNLYQRRRHKAGTTYIICLQFNAK
jgi:hypothetical protein